MNISLQLQSSRPNRFPGPRMGTRRFVNVSDLVALPFRWGSALRGRRFFHPAGVIATGSAKRVAPACNGLPIPSSDVVARISKATGTPPGWPDFIGLALRVPSEARPWDILLVSAGSGVLTRALALRPVTSWAGQNMSTLMPLTYRGKRWWVRARIETQIDGTGLSLDDVRSQIDRQGIQVTLEQASGGSDFETLAQLTLDTVIGPTPDRPGTEVSFDPVLNTAPGVKLFPGWLADLRASAYAYSREGRD